MIELLLQVHHLLGQLVYVLVELFNLGVLVGIFDEEWLVVGA